MATLTLSQTIQKDYEQPSVTLEASYSELAESDFDLGFRTEDAAGKDVHQLTRDLTVSIQNFHDGRLTNLLYSNARPVRLEFSDPVIHPYVNDYVEIRYIVSGTLLLEFEDERKEIKKIEFRQGEVCLINPRKTHRELIGESRCLLLNIGIRRHFFSESMLNRVSLDPLQKFLRTAILARNQALPYLVFSPDNEDISRDITWYLRALLREIRDRRPGYLEISSGYLIRLTNALAAGYRYNFSEDESKVYYKKLFESVALYMREHIADVKIEDLSREFHFHPNYFNNLIRKFTGLTYSNYLIGLRIDAAKKLLKSTDLSVEEIMWLIGYHNRGFFYKKFEESTGMSPSRYRKCGNEL